MLRELFQSGKLGSDKISEQSQTRVTRAYESFWRLGPDAALESYRSALAEIREAEAALPGAEVQTILKEASEAWYRESGHCPFCGGPELHSPAEAILEGT